MKKLLISGMYAILIAPSVAFAAYNDVSLTTATVFSVNGVEIDVLSSSAIESAVVNNDGTLNISLRNDSHVEVRAPNRNQMTITEPNGVRVVKTCSSSESSASITSIVPATVTITPSSSLCSSSGSGNGPISSGGGGGGGGGGAVTVSAPALAATASATTRTASPAQTAPARAVSAFARDLKLGSVGDDVKTLQIYLNTHGYTVAESGPGSSGMETTRFGAATKAALAKLQRDAGISPATGYFGKKTRDSIAGSAAPAATPVRPVVSESVSATGAFSRNLQIGSTGEDVKALQVYLNTHGYTVAKSGPGSSGMETTRFGAATKAALAKLQRDAGISPAAGYFGPATRTYILSHQ